MDSIKKIVDDAEKMLQILQIGPIVEHYESINNILDFCKTNNKIVYGGYALHNILCFVTGKNVIYDITKDRPDVEFFSNDPSNDVIKLCDFVSVKNHQKNKYFQIDAKEALHEGTFKIFQNYSDLCDISYIQSNIEKFLIQYHTITIEGMHYISLEMMFIDKMRVFSNPTAYNRLEKEISRLSKFIEHITPTKFYDEKKEDKEIKNRLYDERMSFCIQQLIEIEQGFGLQFMIVDISINSLCIITCDYELLKGFIMAFIKAKRRSDQSLIIVIEHQPLFFVSDGKTIIICPDGMIIEIHNACDNMYNHVKKDFEVNNKIFKYINMSTLFTRLTIEMTSLLCYRLNKSLYEKKIDKQCIGAIERHYDDVRRKFEQDFRTFKDLFQQAGQQFMDKFSLSFIGKPASRTKKRLMKKQVQQLQGVSEFIYNPMKIIKTHTKQMQTLSFKDLSGLVSNVQLIK